MNTARKALIVPLILLAFGCSGKPQTVPIRPAPATAELPELPAASQSQAPEGDLFDALSAVSRDSEPRFLKGEQAPETPQIRVTTREGREQTIQPGKAGFVTLLVAWSVETPEGQAAMQHASDLARHYGRVRVRAVGLVQRTRGADYAPVFAAQQRIAAPLYYDDLSQNALRKLAKAIGAREPAAVPAILIVDRRLRLRYYQPGFNFARVAKMHEENTGAPQSIVIRESAPAGRSVEDYLRRILQETH